MISLYQQHVKDWAKGCGSDCCSKANKIVFAKGKIPADIVLVGEAPGASEDIRGVPFDGPAGELLDKIVEDSFGSYRVCSVCRRGNRFAQFPSGENPTLCDGGHGEGDSEPLRIAYYNLVGCLPIREEGSKSWEPSKEQIKSCQPKIKEFLSIAKPRMIVAVGSKADKYLPDLYMSKRNDVMFYAGGKVEGHPTLKKWTSIIHPAAILRSVPAQKSLLIRRATVTLANAVAELF